MQDIVFRRNILMIGKLVVTLEEFAGFLCIKAVWEIEDFLGYG